MSDSLGIWHPFTQAALDPSPIEVERAQGVYIYTRDGRKLIDGISSWWVNIHGHAHPRIASAIAEQAARLEHVIFAGFTHEPAQRLAAKLRTVVPSGLSHIFFSDNGSTAVEVAIKMAVQYWKNRGDTQREKIVALEHAYHGDTAGAMSLNADSPFTDAFRSLRFPVLRAHSAYCYRCPVGKEWDSCEIECLDPFEEMLEERSGEIAAMIIEPLVQAAGGMIIHPPEYIAATSKLCRQHDVLLIADEVFTGFGRTGTMFACERVGITPDIMCLSKGLTGGFLPFSATLCSYQVYDAFNVPDRTRTFFHGHSYTGNPIGCAAAIASLEIFETEPVFDRIRTIERIHRERLPLLAGQELVGDLRMIGTVAAIELKTEDAGYLSEIRPTLYNYFIDNGFKSLMTIDFWGTNGDGYTVELTDHQGSTITITDGGAWATAE